MHQPGPDQKEWKGGIPKRILLIRLQAIGDTILMLPFAENFRRQLPEHSEIDLLTREVMDEVPNNIFLFRKVYAIKGGRSSKKQLISLLTILPLLLARRYDAVLDLQNNRISRIARKTLRPGCWSQFDTQSPIPALRRYEKAILSSGIVKEISPSYGFKLKSKQVIDKAVIDHRGKLVLLNPAGAFETRNWPLEKYIAFSELWLKEYPDTKFLFLGLSTMKVKSAYLKEKLGGHAIDLTGRTSQLEVLEILKYVSLTVSEDSGLLHMSYLSGIPSIGMLGSTRNDWTNPQLNHTYFYHSSDLPCGNCMRETCSRGDNLCMTRIDPADVFRQAKKLITAYPQPVL
ncbi:MAG: glycosyltransferase family 9 protein [Bacteroidia bacterium]